jgi:hypothetical protein
MGETLIVGFGRSGQDLHLRCLRKLPRRRIGVVDVEPARLGGRDLPEVEVFPDLAAARERFGAGTVVHICTPPSTHLEVLRDVARLGYSRVIVEKPLVSRAADLAPLRALVREHGLAVFVVANWLTSSLTSRLRKLLGRCPERRWARLSISQVKPRFTRSLLNYRRETIFDVEIPHQIALSLLVAGGALEVRDAVCSDMIVDRTRIPCMGKATITLADRDGRPIVVHSDLTAPIRQRSIELLFEDGTRTVGYYPSTDADHFSQLLSYGNGQVQHEIFLDDPLAAFMAEVYGYFEAEGRPPASDVDFNAAVVATISKAKAAAGIESQ